MSTTVNREDCVTVINQFIKTTDINNAATLFKYLCEAKGKSDKTEAIQIVCSNSFLLSIIANPTIETLIAEFSINKVSDKNNNLILVY